MPADSEVSAQDPHSRSRADVGGVEMSYVDTGSLASAAKWSCGWET